MNTLECHKVPRREPLLRIREKGDCIMMEKPIKIDDLGVPPFQETSISNTG